ncbi:MAG: ATP-binding cassette domain-containing protein, partial [Phycisphaerae bacterium]
MRGRKRTTAARPTKAVDSDGVDWLTVVGARQNNLRDLTVEIPLARFVCVTGVSGSGKSSLVNDILWQTLNRDLNEAVKVNPGAHDRIEGLEQLDKVINIDQSPIGRTPRSNPATYIKVFDEIRTLYAKLPDSKMRGYKPGRFSFNVHTGRAGGGRCEACEGNGQNKVEMDFLADMWVTCPVCSGRRFSRETMQVLYKGKSIADVLEMDVQEALTHFENVPKIAEMLRTLHDVGLDYIKLGQSSTTLSGGEAQRIKLARELVKRSTGRTLYLLDEPTTGLHFDDIKKLLAVLHRFVDSGNTVIVIEHNLDVVKTADWIIDLGPEGGARGGRVVATGTPEKVAQSKRSHTGRVLRSVLTGDQRSARKAKPSGSRRAGITTPRQQVGRPSRSDAVRRNVVTVVGAKQHNLKDITVEMPRGKTTVCCGPSGSGKSSFAIDTVYTEGQRRYVESLSAYARQFLSRLQPPRVDHVSGLSPAICIEQKAASKSPRSTVGTITEIYDYMRVLWARIGRPYCPSCKVPITSQTSDEIVEKVMTFGEGQRVLLLAPVEPASQETYEHLFQRERKNGYARVRIDGTVCSLDEPITIDGRRRHTVELVVDRIVVRKKQTARLTDSVEQALSVGEGVMIAQSVGESRQTKVREVRFSQHHSCEDCGRSYEELTPHHFSFNSRLGWCPTCEGLGTQRGASPAAIVTHPTRSIIDGAIGGWGVVAPDSSLYTLLRALADHIGFDLNRPWNDLTEPQRLTVLHGCGDEWIDAARFRKRRGESASSESGGGFAGVRFKWRGFFPAIDRATRASWQYRKRLEELVTDVPCDACLGGRLRTESAAVRVGNATIHEVCLWPLSKSLHWFDSLKLSPRERTISGELLHEITSRLRFLVEVGLDYVTLHRTASTLSGGESQRIQLASQIGTGLTGVLYVLDEPTIGLHPR